jgi:hypothetical protein
MDVPAPLLWKKPICSDSLVLRAPMSFSPLDGRQLRIRCVVQPDRAHSILIYRLGLELRGRCGYSLPQNVVPSFHTKLFKI